MRSESGLTLIETAVALSIIALLAGLAVLSGSSMLRSAQISRAISKLNDHLALARMSAIARSETWRIQFDSPPAGSMVVRSWVVEYREPGGATWTAFDDPYTLEDGLAIEVPFEGGHPVPLQFNRFGRFGREQNIDLKVCRVQSDAGVESCQSGSVGRVIRIHGKTGVVEY